MFLRSTAFGALTLGLSLTAFTATAQLAGGGEGDTIVLKSGVKYLTTRPGTGERPSLGQRVWVHYTGKLTDGHIFDTSSIKGKPLKFAVGRGDVIPGVDEVVGVMKVGQKVTAFIPARFGYGPAGQAEEPDEVDTAYRIPPNADLIFELELVKVQ